jgi:hypothetical protein
VLQVVFEVPWPNHPAAAVLALYDGGGGVVCVCEGFGGKDFEGADDDDDAAQEARLASLVRRHSTEPWAGRRMYVEARVLRQARRALPVSRVEGGRRGCGVRG